MWAACPCSVRIRRYEEGEISFRELITRQMSCLDLSFEEGIERIAAGCRQHIEQQAALGGGGSTGGGTTGTGVVDPGFCSFVRTPLPRVLRMLLLLLLRVLLCCCC